MRYPAAVICLFALTATAEEVGTKPVTLEAKGRPLPEVLEALSGQSGLKTEWWGNGEPPAVDVSVKEASLLETVASLCKAHGWGISLFGMDGDYTLKVDGTQTRLPVLAYAAQGPVLLAWHGCVTKDEFDFSLNPPAPKKVTKYLMSLFVDPLSHTEVLDRAAQKTARDFPLTLTLADGKTLTLASEHRPNVFGTDMQWEYLPKAEIDGLKGTLSVTLPFEVPARLCTTEVPFATGKTDAEGVRIDLEAAAPVARKERDPKDFFKEIDVRAFEGKLHLIHAAALGLEEVRPYERKREPTAEEAKRLKALEEGTGALQAHAFFLLMKDGTALPGQLKRTNGISSPWHGYRFDLKFLSPDLKAEAKALRISFVEGTVKKEAAFRIEGAEFRKPD